MLKYHGVTRTNITLFLELEYTSNAVLVMIPSLRMCNDSIIMNLVEREELGSGAKRLIWNATRHCTVKLM